MQDGACEAGDPWAHNGEVSPGVRLGPLPGPAIGWEGSPEGWASPSLFLLPQKGALPWVLVLRPGLWIMFRDDALLATPCREGPVAMGAWTPSRA